jgi:alkylated DNA repair protein (DNA oxidative demethylase)
MQLGLDLLTSDPDAGAGPGPARVVLPDVVHIPGWLSPSAQADLVADVRVWALPPAGLRHPRVPTGHLMTVQSVCLGWHWS